MKKTIISCGLALCLTLSVPLSATLQPINYQPAVLVNDHFGNPSFPGQGDPCTGHGYIDNMDIDVANGLLLVVDRGLVPRDALMTHDGDPTKPFQTFMPWQSPDSWSTTDPMVTNNGDYVFCTASNYPAGPGTVQRYNPDGTAAGTWNTVAYVDAIAEDDFGNFWTFEDYSHAQYMRKYDSTGTLLNQWYYGSLPMGIDFVWQMQNYNGRIYLAEGARISSFDPSGDVTSSATWIHHITDDIQDDFWAVGGFQITADGRAYVMEQSYMGSDPTPISVYDLSGAPDTAANLLIQTIYDPLADYNLVGIGVDAAGNLFVASSDTLDFAGTAIVKLAHLEDDDDGDGVGNSADLCPGTPPGTWVDEDGCPVPDTDGDGVFDPCDLCPGTPPGTQVNDQGCPDADGDGVTDTDDLCPDTSPGTQVNADGCPDEDGDGVADANDLCPGTAPGVPVDADGCPIEFSLVMTAQNTTAWGDYNNDGFSDLFGGDTVWTNNGDGTFTATTPFWGMGPSSVGDYNNDGHLDVVSLPSANVARLYTNDGDGTWTNDSSKFITGSNPWNVAGTTFGDFNGDGYLDTYWTGWYLGSALDQDVIYMSNAAATFTHTWSAPIRHGKGVTICDFDEDADIDILVSNYWLNVCFLWQNNGFDGYTGLTDIGSAALDGSGHTQGSTFGDFDNDGDFDIFIANFAHPGNPECRFQQNQGPPGYGFSDIGKRGVMQVEPLEAATTGDFDNDGDLDLAVTVSPQYSWTTAFLYSNNGDFTFTDVTADVALDGLGPEGFAAFGDYNNDGYLDLVFCDALYRNPGGANHWLKVKLLGGPHPDGLVNGSAIGAQVRIDVPGLGTLTRQVEGNTGAFGMQNDQVLHFGLGDYSSPVDLDIAWPNGYEQTVYNVAVDQAITIQLQPPVTVPPCWEYDTQCHGDTDGDGDVDTVDWPTFRDAFGYAYPDAQYHPCGDMDHDGDVDTVDWPEFRDNFGYSAVADCTPGGIWPPIP